MCVSKVKCLNKNTFEQFPIQKAKSSLIHGRGIHDSYVTFMKHEQKKVSKMLSIYLSSTIQSLYFLITYESRRKIMLPASIQIDKTKMLG